MRRRICVWRGVRSDILSMPVYMYSYCNYIQTGSSRNPHFKSSAGPIGNHAQLRSRLCLLQLGGPHSPLSFARPDAAMTHLKSLQSKTLKELSAIRLQP